MRYFEEIGFKEANIFSVVFIMFVSFHSIKDSVENFRRDLSFEDCFLLVFSDFDWSFVEPTIVATCSADTNTYLWDIRCVFLIGLFSVYMFITC